MLQEEYNSCKGLMGLLSDHMIKHTIIVFNGLDIYDGDDTQGMIAHICLLSHFCVSVDKFSNDH